MEKKRVTDHGPSGTKRSRVLAFVRDRGEISRGEISAAFDLDKKTVSGIVEGLLADRLLVPSGFRESQAGRRQELLSLNGSHSNYVGIDLGATHIIGVLTDLNARPLDRVYFEIRPGLPAQIILEQMKTVTRSLLGSPKATARVACIGVCVPGFVNPRTGVSLIAENIPGWREVPVKSDFEAGFSLPVLTDDCSRALGLAERRLGAGRARSDFILLDLGYGIGMALCLEGRLYAGSAYKSGEIGHSIVEPGGAACTCGNRGCLETVASGRAIAGEAAAGIAAGKSELLAGLTHGKAENATAQDVAIAARMGDPFAVELTRRAGAAIGLSLANAVNILNPASVILGGGLITSNNLLVESIRASLHANAMPGIREELALEISTLGVDGSALGAAILATSPVFAPA
jgi:N-acetylglucosamine repressor